MRITGQKLSRAWNVQAAHVLYHHDGTWYHHLRSFPGVLFDPSGYIRFETEREYRIAHGLQHGAHLHVNCGIHRLPGYVRMA